jgi:hypothetical protein
MFHDSKDSRVEPTAHTPFLASSLTDGANCCRCTQGCKRVSFGLYEEEAMVSLQQVEGLTEEQCWAYDERGYVGVLSLTR